MNINKFTNDFFEEMFRNQKRVAENIERSIGEIQADYRDNLAPGVSQEDLDF